jgi:hypothetical protein
MITGLPDAARRRSAKEATMKIQLLAGSLLGAGLILLALLLHDRPADAKAVPAVVRAKTIELVDGRGRVRAQLKVEPGGQVVFRLRDRNGVVRTKLGADEAGSGLLLLDEQTEPGIHLVASRNGTTATLRRGEKRLVLRPGD